MTSAEKHLKEEQIEEALEDLQNSIRKDAANLELRIFLFQLLCVIGEWERALNQLRVLKNLKGDAALLAQIFQYVIACEPFRAAVFAGEKAPLVFGQPAEWVSFMVQALQEDFGDTPDNAQKLREKALDSAPDVSGRINGETAFEWMIDADSRLGPILEAIFQGKYYWVPIQCIKELTVEAPSDLRDLVWIPTTFIWTNGGKVAGYIPSRYPGTEMSVNNALRLARKTDWEERADDLWCGLGQRMLATDQNSYPLLEIRKIEFNYGGTDPNGQDPALFAGSSN